MDYGSGHFLFEMLGDFLKFLTNAGEAFCREVFDSFVLQVDAF